MPHAVHAATLDVSSLALSSTMMSCTVHTLMDSLALWRNICTFIFRGHATMPPWPFHRIQLTTLILLCSTHRVDFTAPGSPHHHTSASTSPHPAHHTTTLPCQLHRTPAPPHSTHRTTTPPRRFHRIQLTAPPHSTYRAQLIHTQEKGRI